MQARLELIVLALAAALVLGGGLGYTLKPTSVTSVPARVIVIDGPIYPNDPCVFVGKHKEC